MRKALVNDVVHSFCYAVRTGRAWPVVILQQRFEVSLATYPAQDLVPFACYAYCKQRNYLLANRQIVLLSSWLRVLTAEERNYAATLMEKYYGITISARETV